MPTCFLAPDPCQGTFFLPGTNTPGVGVQVFFFANLSTTHQTAYKDPLGATPHTNPIVLDAGGNIPSGAEVWFVQGQTYTVVYAPATDIDPPASPYRTLDNLTGMNDASGSQSQWDSAPSPSFVSPSSFTMAGDQTAVDLADIGRRMQFTVTAGTVYGTIQSRSFGGGLTTVVVDMDGAQALDAGLSAASYGLLTATNDAVPLLPGGRSLFMDPTDPTKRFGFDLSGITASTVRMYVMPNTDSALIAASTAQSMFSKTLVSPILNTSVSGSALASSTQANVGTSNALLVTPAAQSFHPSAVKAWGMVTSTGSLSASYNIASVTDVGIGTLEMNWTIPFSSATYCAMATAKYNPGGNSTTTIFAIVRDTNFTESTCRFGTIRLSDFTAFDVTELMVMAAGFR